MDSYQNTRASLISHPEGRRFAGWTQWASLTKAEFTLIEGGIPATGTVVKGQLHGIKRLGSFVGLVTSVSDCEIKVEFLTSLQEALTVEDARVLVEGLRGRIKLKDRTIPFQVEEMNSKGLGMLTSEAIPVNQEVDLGLVTHEDILVAPATIRHCREFAPGRFRSGAFMHLFGRVEQARWRKIMQLYFRGSANATVRNAA
jgi:hypothetical protein